MPRFFTNPKMRCPIIKFIEHIKMKKQRFLLKFTKSGK